MLSNRTRTLKESVALLSSRSVLGELPESELSNSEFSEFLESSRRAPRGSGSISKAELGQVMRSLGENPTGMELEVIAEMAITHT